MRPLLAFLVFLPSIAQAGNPCCYRSKVYYTPASVVYKAPAPTPAKKDHAVSDADLAGEVGRRIARYEAGLRALGVGPAYQQASTSYAQASAQASAPQAQVPYVQGSTPYALQSIDVFGESAFDKLAMLIDGQQRIASQTSSNSAQIAVGVQGQIDSLTDGIKAASANNAAALEIAAQTDAMEVLGAAMVQLAQATKPEPRASIRTNQYAPQVAPSALPPKTQSTPSAQASVGIAAASGFPTLRSTCAKCHSGPNAQSGLVLDGSAPLGDKFAAVMRTVVEGKTASGAVMPPAGDNAVVVSQEQRLAIIRELCELK